MAAPRYEDARWHKSSYSNGDAGSACLEVAVDGDVYTRDSTLRKESPVISFSPEAWAGLIAKITGAQA